MEYTELQSGNSVTNSPWNYFLKSFAWLC